MLTYIEMNNLSASELEHIAFTANNRNYAKACRCFANSLRALAAADQKMARMWADASKKAHALAENEELDLIS